MQSHADASLRHARLRLVTALALAVILSQFFRSSLGVIAPELSADLALTPEMLGFANACFFIALGLMQVPIGVMFDRIGVRTTYLWLTGAAAAGALVQAWAETGTGLALARLLMGIGSGAGFMSVVILCARWFPPERLASAMSVIFALSQFGVLLAATPLAAATAAYGWRPVFVASALVTVACGVVYALFVRDDPPGAPPHAARGAQTGALEGLARVLRTPGIWRVLALQLFAYAAVATLLGLWAGPYLADVHGLGPVARGNVLLAMGIGQFVGVLAIGPLDRLFDTRKWVVVGGAVAALAALALLAWLQQPPLAVAVALLVFLAAASQYPLVNVALGRGMFAADIAGRGVTTVNIAQVTGAAALPWITGAVMGYSSGAHGPHPELAYRLVFATIAALLAIVLVLYLRVEDVKPSQRREAG